MGNVILLLWSIYMIWQYAKGIKRFFEKDRDIKMQQARVNLHALKNDSVQKGVIIAITFLAVVFQVIFWLVLAASTPFVLITLYAAAVIIIYIASLRKIRDFIDDPEKLKLSFSSVMLMFVNMIVVIIFAIQLIGRM